MLLHVLSVPLLAALVSAHARMTAPTPWLGTGFANAANCNAGTAQPPRVTWVAGATANISWFIQASDGSGPVTLSLDSTGGVTFNAASNIAFQGDTNPNRVNVPYVFTFTVPNANCNTAKGCTLRAKSSSNWVSCTSINIVAADVSLSPTPAASVSRSPSPSVTPSASYIAPSPSTSVKPSKSPNASAYPSSTPTAKPSAAPSASSSAAPQPGLDTGDDTVPATCVTASDLTLCSAINGKSVQLNVGIFPGAATMTPAMFEQLFVQKTYDQESNNPLVFLKAGNTSCTDAYLRFLCSRMFLSCGETAPTMSSCNVLKAQCQPANEHAFLYNCSDPTVASGTARLDSYPQTIVTPGAGTTDPTITDPSTDPITDPVQSPSTSKKPVSQNSGAERVSVTVSAVALLALAAFAL